MKILILDDDGFNRLFLRKVLERTFSYQNIIEAENCGEAIELCQNNNFDLILTDIHLGGMSGLDFAKHLRDNKNFVPIVAITSDCDRVMEEKCKVAGIDYFLGIPLEAQNFVKVVEDAQLKNIEKQ